MSIRRNTGGYITYNPVEPSGSMNTSAADGVWSLAQQMQYKEEGNWPDPANIPQYIEDIFSTWLYSGNASTQTITNGINLSGNGGLVWAKSYSTGGGSAEWALYDTTRGAAVQLRSSSAGGNINTSPQFSSFNTNGFSLNGAGDINYSGHSIVSFTFRKQPKFFDIVYYTGNGSSKTISHNLGSVPGCIIVKSTSTGDWMVYHRSLGNASNLWLNYTNGAVSSATAWNSTSPTSTTFTVGANGSTNTNGQDYIAYLFAHDAGGFGDSNSSNVVSCGSFTADGSGNATVNLGYEPQWVLIKSSSETNNWAILNNMQNFVANGSVSFLRPNVLAGITGGGLINPNSTGFYSSATLSASATYIYIAIRRGPMRTPTSGTSVFSPVTYTGNASSPRSITGSNFPVDLVINDNRNGTNTMVVDRLRGLNQLQTTTTNAEGSSANGVDGLAQMDGVTIGANLNFNTAPYINWYFRRAPSFFDMVCYAGDGTFNRPMPHNLGAVPELIIWKARTYSYAVDWLVWQTSLGGTLPTAGNYLNLNNNSAVGTSYQPQDALPTATQLTLRPSGSGNASGFTYVAYLFASCPGVSKVGSYTGTGTTKQIDCGFTAGARFVLIKRSDSTGDWYVWDTARGIVSGNDPYLLLNSTAAEDTSTDYIDTYSAGFEISSTAPAAINANGGTFVFLAIA